MIKGLTNATDSGDYMGGQVHFAPLYNTSPLANPLGGGGCMSMKQSSEHVIRVRAREPLVHQVSHSSPVLFRDILKEHLRILLRLVLLLRRALNPPELLIDVKVCLHGLLPDIQAPQVNGGLGVSEPDAVPEVDPPEPLVVVVGSRFDVFLGAFDMIQAKIVEVLVESFADVHVLGVQHVCAVIVGKIPRNIFWVDAEVDGG